MTDNNVTVAGNLTRDPEVRFANSGTAVVKFGLAVNHRFQRNGEWEETVSFFNVIAFGQLAENVGDTFAKGNRALISGRLQHRTWDDEKSGEKRHVTEIIANSIAVDLRWATAEITRNPRSDGDDFANRDYGRGSGGAQKPTAAADPADPGDDPNFYDEEPF